VVCSIRDNNFFKITMRMLTPSLFGNRLMITPVIAMLSSTLVWADPAAGTVLTGNNTVNGAGGIIDGSSSASGYFVSSGTLVINDATLQNFVTTGGSGSGGGAGLGGAIFINSGASVTLNNVSFLSNTAQGGEGGVGTSGGVLNGIVVPVSNGSNGSSGDDGSSGGAYVNGGNGVNGFNAGVGGNASNGFGGNGGNAGAGSDGSAVTADTVKAALELAKATFEISSDTTESALFTSIAASFTAQAAAAGAGANAAGPTTISLVTAFTALATEFTDKAAESTASISQQVIAETYEAAYLTALTVTSLTEGAAGNGGGGGQGGNAGNGSDFFGGGAGGDGGDGGAAYSGSPSDGQGGAAGAGGNGGTGGFGAGGGQGGNGGTGGSSANAEAGAAGAGGAGGVAGFGGGVGSNGAGFGAPTVDGGSGGSGFGGAIFVRDGGSLTITGNALFDGNNAVEGGTATDNGTSGTSGGTDLFIMKGASVNLNPGAGNVIIFNGGIADDSQANVDSGSPTGRGAGLTISSGLVIFNGENTYTGQTVIAGGVLQAQDGTGIHNNSSINFNGGVLQSNGDFTRYVGIYNATNGLNSSRVMWEGDGGFAAVDGALDVRLSNGQTMVWNSGGFVTTGHSLIFGSETATDTVTFQNSIDLAAGNRTILVKANDAMAATLGRDAIQANVDNAILNGVLSNGALTVGDSSHTGVLILTNANTYAGGTTVNGGTLALATRVNEFTGAVVSTGSLNANGAVVVNTGATFDFSQTGDQAIGTLAGGGTVAIGDNTLTLNQATDTTFSGAINDGGIADPDATGGSLTKKGAGTLTLSGTNGYTGTTQIDAGRVTLTGSLASLEVNVATGATLDVVNSGLTALAALTNAGTLNLSADDTVASFVSNAGTLNGTGHTLTAATYALNTDSVINANLGTGEVTANGTVTLTGTSAASKFTIETGTVTLSSAERLLDTVQLTIDSGAGLVLGGAEKIGTLTGGGTLNNNGDRLTVDSGDFSGVISGAGGLTKVTTGTLVLSGVNTYTGSTLINAGTLTLDGSLAGATVNVAAGATLNNNAGGLAPTATLTNDGTVVQNADDTIAALINTGTIDGTFTLTAATYALNNGSVINAHLGTGIVNANGTVALNGTSSAETVNIQTGTTTLGSAERLLDTTDLTISGGATLVLGGAETIGTLDGAGDLQNNGGLLTVDDGTFSGVISGAGGLTKNTTGTLVLSGANTYTGATTVAAGVVTLDGSLVSNVLVIDSGATLNDTAAGLAADTAATVNGTLHLTAAETIDTLDGSGSVILDDSRLTLSQGDFSGVVSGSSGLTKVSAGTLALSGVNTYAGSTEIDAGTVNLTGSLASTSVTIDSGATLNSTTGGLASGAVVNNAGTLNLGAADDTITTLNNTGTLDGTATLTATTYNTRGGSVINANLGTGTLNVSAGTTILNGTSDAATVNVLADGVLTLSFADRLIDTAAVSVAGTLNLNGGNETIRTLDGAGIININTYILTVTEGGSFTGTLNASTLVSDGGDLVLDGGETTNESTNVNNGGSLEITGGGTVNTGDTTVDEDSSLDVTGGGTLNSNDGIIVKDGANLTVGDTGTVTTLTTVTVQAGGQLTLQGGYSLGYDILTGSGLVETDGAVFTNVAGSTVKGFLTFSDDFTNNGTFAPGNSPGTTVIAGNYTEAGTLEAELETTTAGTGYDQIRVGGSVTIAPGATLVVQTFNGALPARGDVYQIISDLSGASVVINGTFDSVLFDLDGVAGSGAAVSNAAVVFDVATGRLIATGLNAPGSTFADLGANGNQRSAAAAIFAAGQDLVGPNQVDTSLISGPGFLANQLIDAAGSPSADLARYTPDYYGALADYAFTGDRALARRVQDRVSVTSELAGSQYVRGGAFAGMISGNTDTADNATVDRRDYFAGADLIVADGFKLGLVVSQHDGDISAPLGTAEADGIGGLVYARYALSPKLTVFGTLGYSNYDYDLRRSTVNGVVTGSTDATALTGTVGVRHQGWTKGRLSVTPRLSLAYSGASVDAFTETGAIDALANDGYDSTFVTAEAGASAVWTAPVFGRTFSVELNLGVEQVLADDNDALNVRVAATPAIAYPVNFADEDSTRLTYGLNAGYNVYKAATVYAGVSGNTGNGSGAYVNFGVRLGF
jgi:fibronectin-binding autotransporter adhesin